MKKISNEDKLFYFEKHFFTLDGLWMIETENEVGWETALKIDVRVWKRLLKIIIRRLKKYLNIETNTLSDIIEILTFRWSIENWDYEVVKNEKDEALIHINSCPYKAMMDRNPDRQNRVPLICKEMCMPFYDSVVKDFNPDLKLERNEFMGLGGKICNFKFTS